MYDLIIVGAGPAGNHLAQRLATVGHRVLVLERKPQPGWKSCCTGIIGQECARRFGIPDAVLRTVNSARLISPFGTSLDLRRTAPQAVILDRRTLDITLSNQAMAAGAEYIFDAAVIDIDIGPRHVVVNTGGKWSGVPFEARAIAIAGGFNPSLLRASGFGRFPDFAIGAQADVQTEAREVEVFFGRPIAPGFFAWLVPTRPGFGRAGLISRAKTAYHLWHFLDKLKDEGKISAFEPRISFGGIPLRTPRKTFGNRMLLVGDAAGQVKPTTGGGIYYGLLGAEAAADTLHQALVTDDLSARSLASYEHSWRKQLGAELRVGYWARRLFERLNDRQLDRIFQVVKANGIERSLLERPDLSFDWHSGLILSLLGNAFVSALIGRGRVPDLADIDREAEID